MQDSDPNIFDPTAAVSGVSCSETSPKSSPQSPAKPESEDDLLDESEAAKVLTMARGTLSVWRSTGRYNIPFIKVGRRVRYKRGALRAWLNSRTRENGATSGGC